MAYDLKGRHALVTGGATGIGMAIAEALIAAGAKVAISDIDVATGTATATRIGAHFVAFDVTDDAGWAAAMPQVAAALGGLDALVNNAGIEISGLVIDTDPAALRKMLDVNVVGTMLGCKHAFRAMRTTGGGAIVNIASVAATIAFPGISGYSATKSAVDRLTRIAANESGRLGYGVRVNCLYPGLVPTAMGAKLAADMAEIGLAASAEEAAGGVIAATPLGRLGEVGDMADACVFLLSDAARFITGTGLAVDGGMGS